MYNASKVSTSVPCTIPTDNHMTQIYFIDWPQSASPALRMACADFTIAMFDSAAFHREGIECPPQIARSVAKRQLEFLHGRRCARAAMALLLRGMPPQLGIGERRAPLWPSYVIGSISHTVGMAAAVALPAGMAHRGVGLDIENVLDAATATAVRNMVATPAELDLLAPLEAELGADVALTLLFSAKESFFKATHDEIGYYFDFDAIALEWLDPAARRMDFSVRETLSAQWPRGSLSQVGFQFPTPALVATLCLTPS